MFLDLQSKLNPVVKENKVIKQNAISESIDDLGFSKYKDYYLEWLYLLKRSNTQSYKLHHTSYEGLVICDEWLTLSKFKEWYDDNYVAGYVLGSDMRGRTSKLSPSDCWYLPKRARALFILSIKSNGKYPKGVERRAPKKFRARVSPYIAIGRERIELGTFTTPEEAGGACMAEFAKQLLALAELQDCDNIKAGLEGQALAHIESLKYI